jgi:hypothetical protein
VRPTLANDDEEARLSHPTVCPAQQQTTRQPSARGVLAQRCACADVGVQRGEARDIPCSRAAGPSGSKGCVRARRASGSPGPPARGARRATAYTAAAPWYLSSAWVSPRALHNVKARPTYLRAGTSALLVSEAGRHQRRGTLRPCGVYTPERASGGRSRSAQCDQRRRLLAGLRRRARAHRPPACIPRVAREPHGSYAPEVDRAHTHVRVVGALPAVRSSMARMGRPAVSTTVASATSS